MRVRTSGSFRRYTVDPRGVEGGARKLREDGPALTKRLFANRFLSIDKAGSELSSVGWSRADGTVSRDSDADAFGEEGAWLGRILAVALRIDRKRLPAGALRVRRMEAEAAERRSVGERIPPGRRREIVEKIESELNSRMVPATALHAMLWQTEAGELLLNSTSDSANTPFRALFRETFGVTPEPLVTATLAARLTSEKKVAELVPALFSDHGVVVMGDSAAFLGREFLLWLWYCGETQGGRFVLESEGQAAEVGVAFDQLLELGGAQEGGRVLVRGDLPTRAPEAASALMGGRLPLRARLVLASGDKSFDVTLAAETFDLEAVKITAEAEELSSAADDGRPSKHDEERAGWLFELRGLLDGLFAEFLKQRMAKSFDADLVPAIRHWIAARGRSRARAATVA